MANKQSKICDLPGILRPSENQRYISECIMRQEEEPATSGSGVALAQFRHPFELDSSDDSGFGVNVGLHSKLGSGLTVPSWKSFRIPRLRDGWRFGAFVGVIFANVVLLLNISLTVWGSLQSTKNGHIFQGSCKVSQRLNIGIHLIINVLSTLLLGASNFSMQCLCAPTRREIDLSHKEGLWLDVGVQSFRNIRSRSLHKRWLWLTLWLSSVPLHLLYNAMFYSSSVHYEYMYISVSEAWVHGAPFDTISHADSELSFDYRETFKNEALKAEKLLKELQLDVVHNATKYERLNATSCIKAYAHDYVVDRSHVILISELPYDVDIYSPWVFLNPYPPVYVWEKNLFNRQHVYSDRFGWVCDHDSPEENTPCNSGKAMQMAAAGNWTVNGYTVTGCLSLKEKELCSVNFSQVIGIVVIVANFGKAICVTAVCILLNGQPLLTIGDAVNSFLQTTDRWTKGFCLITKGDVHAEWRSFRRTGAPKPYLPKSHRRWKATGRPNWVKFFCLYSMCLVTLLILINYAILRLREDYARKGSFSDVMALGFGTAKPQTLIRGPGWNIPKTGKSAVLFSSIVANVPQILLSGLYLIVNNLFTRIHLVTEWASYSTSRKPLRVSDQRKGAQRSAYFLQLPYRTGLPLMAISVALHWLLSQSLFLASIESLPTHEGEPEYSSMNQSRVTCGWSPLAMICLLVLGFSAAVPIIFAAMRPLEGSMPLVKSCSLGIAAACHPPEGGNDGEKPLMWGAVGESIIEDSARQGAHKSGKEIGHCSFSSTPVDVPMAGRLYR
jgi:hypothetical protein